MGWGARAGLAVLVLALAGALAPPAGAVSLQSIGAYSQPVYVTSDPSNPDRLFIVERAGRIMLTTPRGTSTFVDLTSRVESGYEERGLLSVAFAPDFAAVEETFVNKNPGSTLKLGQARGIAMLAPALRGIPVAEYAPNQVKKSVVGVGHADKAQIHMMVGILLPGVQPSGPDAADAEVLEAVHRQAGEQVLRVASAYVRRRHVERLIVERDPLRVDRPDAPW